MHIGTAWKIHPSYDLAHDQWGAVEYITHSIATLEFESSSMSSTASHPAIPGTRS